MSKNKQKNKQNKQNVFEVSGVEELDDASCVAVKGGFYIINAQISNSP